MTISVKSRREQRDLVLRIMGNAVGLDTDYDQVQFSVEDRPFTDVPRTTWPELAEGGRVKRLPQSGPEIYRLTGRGWIDAIRSAGLTQSQESQERCSRTMAGLKAHVQRDSEYHQLVDLYNLEQETGLSRSWLFNATNSGLLREEFSKKNMNAYYDADSRGIRVPSTFGMTLIDSSS